MGPVNGVAVPAGHQHLHLHHESASPTGGRTLRTLSTGRPIGLSSLTLAELSYGVEKGRSDRNRVVLEGFVQPLEVVPFGPEAAWRYGEVRNELERRGTPIGALDTLIAAHALALGLTLVTHNTREFDRVEGLRVENWF